MDKCPPELHAYICQLIDDGNTIRSINKASRYFYNVSKPYLYQILSISGPKQILAVATLLETKPKGYLRIRHLFISEITSSDTEKLGHSESVIQATPEAHSLILRIISLSAPTLESLAFVPYSPQTSTSLIARLFKTSFPRLRDLTVCGFYPFPATPGKFPQLERLHLSGNRNPHGLLQMSVLESACPSLKLLKISGLALAASFVAEVKEAMGNIGNEKEESMSLFPAKFPHRVRRVTLQAGPSPEFMNGGKDGSIQLKDRLMMEGLEDLNREATTDLNAVRVIALDRSPQPVVGHDIMQEWLKSINTF